MIAITKEILKSVDDFKIKLEDMRKENGEAMKI